MALRYIPRQQYGIAYPAASIPIETQQQLLESIIDAAISGVRGYHIGTRGLDRYPLKDRMDVLAAAAAAQGAITGQSIAVRRGIPTDM